MTRPDYPPARHPGDGRRVVTGLTPEALAELRRDAESWLMVGGERVLPLLNAYDALRAERDTLAATVEAAIDIAHLDRQRAWSAETFGPAEVRGHRGVLDHIRKELVEIEAEPGDITEWADLIILAFDGAWRSGHTPADTIAAIKAKQERNEARTWPDWRTADPNKAIEHVRALDGFPTAAEVIPLPMGLCGNREDHEPHLVPYAPVANGPMWCTADQSKREPYASERRRDAHERTSMSPLTYCNVAGCTAQQTHHHLDEIPDRPVLCTGESDDCDRYLSTCCELGPLLKPNPAPHGPEEPCTCTGCWDCAGNVLGCTCDIDWDELHEARRIRAVRIGGEA